MIYASTTALTGHDRFKNITKNNTKEHKMCRRKSENFGLDSGYKGQDTSLISGRTFDATKLNNIFGTPGSFQIMNYHLASDGVWKKFIKTEFTTKQTAHFGKWATSKEHFESKLCIYCFSFFGKYICTKSVKKTTYLYNVYIISRYKRCFNSIINNISSTTGLTFVTQI